MLKFLFGVVLVTIAFADVGLEVGGVPEETVPATETVTEETVGEEPAGEEFIAEEPAEEEPVEAIEETSGDSVSDSELGDSDEFNSMIAYNTYMSDLDAVPTEAEPVVEAEEK
ncbi:uncharacterized protein LOC134812670 isoform X2 [Bolinopsis microptera]|uniref:uncharacterized protein LOC134812670 isoform X2 n=1 Tax=Bolinopsis microptera TaxID=2820187 RepID=UPI00307A3C65